MRVATGLGYTSANWLDLNMWEEEIILLPGGKIEKKKKKKESIAEVVQIEKTLGFMSVLCVFFNNIFHITRVLWLLAMLQSTKRSGRLDFSDQC